MELVGNVLYGVGVLGLFIGYLWLLRLAFQRNFVFGLACLLISVVLLYFLVMCLDKTWKPLLLLVCSLATFICGYGMLK